MQNESLASSVLDQGNILFGFWIIVGFVLYNENWTSNQIRE